MTTVGVLALQGDVEPHRDAFARCGAPAVAVRRRSDLAGLTHLAIPGGESTTLHHLLELFGLREEILRRHRAGELALFGTCAGAILLGGDDGSRPPRFGVLDAIVERNAYGRQVDSFRRRIHFDVFEAELDCIFIRAPKFRHIGPGARVLARDGDDPILVSGRGLLAATFHPELGSGTEIHRLFLEPDLWNPPAPVEHRDEQNPQVVRA